MAKLKSSDEAQRLSIPISLENQLMPGALEFANHTLVETRGSKANFYDIKSISCITVRIKVYPKLSLQLI